MFRQASSAIKNREFAANDVTCIAYSRFHQLNYNRRPYVSTTVSLIWEPRFPQGTQVGTLECQNTRWILAYAERQP